MKGRGAGCQLLWIAETSVWNCFLFFSQVFESLNGWIGVGYLRYVTSSLVCNDEGWRAISQSSYRFRPRCRNGRSFGEVNPWDFKFSFVKCRFLFYMDLNIPCFMFHCGERVVTSILGARWSWWPALPAFNRCGVCIYIWLYTVFLQKYLSNIRQEVDRVSLHLSIPNTTTPLTTIPLVPTDDLSDVNIVAKCCPFVYWWRIGFYP